MKYIAVLMISLASCGTDRSNYTLDHRPAIGTRCPFYKGQVVYHAASGERMVITNNSGGLSWDCGCSAGVGKKEYLRASAIVSQKPVQ